MAGVPAALQMQILDRHEQMIRGNALGLVRQAQVYKAEGLE